MNAPSFTASKTFIAMQELSANTLNWFKINVTNVRMSNADLQLGMDFVPLLFENRNMQKKLDSLLCG